MKTIKIIILALMSLGASVSYAVTAPKKVAIVVRSTKYDVFSFKADKKFLGAIIEVYNSSNKLTGKEILFDCRMVIDFYYMPADMYTIKIIKDNEVLEFQFIKK